MKKMKKMIFNIFRNDLFFLALFATYFFLNREKEKPKEMRLRKGERERQREREREREEEREER